jgi:formylglycine-generating enzyme required for sulfatase activity
LLGLAAIHCGGERGSAPPDPAPPAGVAEQAPAPTSTTSTPEELGTFVRIPAGTFTMGSPAGEACREAGETQHAVTLGHGFEIQATEVTQGQFQARMGYNPSHFQACGRECPVEQVMWQEAAAYCNALSVQAKLDRCYECLDEGQEVVCKDAPAFEGARILACPGYRLPTDAEWEYAYRSGSSTALHSGDVETCRDQAADAADKIGWYECNSTVTYDGCFDGSEFACGSPCMGTHPVAKKEPNAWGLYDMSGNVWEWCHDRYREDLGTEAVVDPIGAESGEDRMLRGGAFDSTTTRIRAAVRDPGHPSEALDFCKGFRCVRTL